MAEQFPNNDIQRTALDTRHVFLLHRPHRCSSPDPPILLDHISSTSRLIKFAPGFGETESEKIEKVIG